MVAETPIQIRAATSTDVAACATFDPLLCHPHRRVSEFGDAVERQTVLVAEVGGVVAGYALLHVHFFSRAFIDLVIVDPVWRRRGIGSRLVESWCSRAEQRGEIFTSTNRSNRPMQRLLSRLGFKPCGIIHDLDPDDPERIYRKVLTGCEPPRETP